MRQLYKFSESELSVLKRELKISGQPIHNLTRNYYFRAVKYALSGFDGTVLHPNVTYVKKMRGQMYRKAQRYKLNPDIFMSYDVCAYNKYTINWAGDAIDNFGTIKNPDCPIEFQQWYDEHAYNGGHPFEIYPFLCLYVRRKNNAFYLELANFGVDSVFYLEKLLKMFIALRCAGVPVDLCNRDSFLKYWQNYNLKNR